MNQVEGVLVTVPPARWERWRANFAARHPGELVHDGPRTSAADGSWYEVGTVFAPAMLSPDMPESVPVPVDWGVVIVRKGGFAVARMAGESLVSSKVGRRHVQGRTKAGGQSQQRFARRRDNQARQAYEACADHATQHLAGLRGPVVTGGDEGAVREVLEEPRLRGTVVVRHFGDVVEPRRDTLEAFVERCLAWQVRVHDTTR